MSGVSWERRDSGNARTATGTRSNVKGWGVGVGRLAMDELSPYNDEISRVKLRSWNVHI
jgi:hypothetical protein